MNSEPLDVPPDYDSDEAVKRGVETGNWSLHETAARRVCRLMIESARKSPVVNRWLLETRRLGDQAWNELMISLGRETPDLTAQINRLKPSVVLINWAVSNAALVVREDRVIKEEKQTDSG